MLETKEKFFRFKKQIFPFYRLYKEYVKKYLFYVFLSAILMIVSAITTSGIAYIIGPMINKVFIDKEKNLLVLTCLGLIVLYFIKTFATYIQNVCMRNLSERVITDLRVSFFEKVVKMPMKNLETTENGKIISVFLNDINKIGNEVNEIFVTSIRDFVTVIFLIMLVFYNNFLLALISVCIYPVIFVPLKKITKSIRNLVKESQDYLQGLTANITDIINGMKTIKSYGTEHFETNKMKKILILLTKTCLNAAKKSSAISPLTEFTSGFSLALVIFVGGWQIIHGYSDVGRFFSFFTALIMVHRPARSLSGINIKLTTCSVSLDRFFSFIDNLENEEINKGIKTDLSNAIIKFENVNFDYEIQNRIQKEDLNFSILQDINFEIKPKQKIAFVGGSGSGKSTIVGLLLRLYVCKSGKITLNNCDINDIALSCLRNSVAYVGQDNFLFDDSIKNNIVYGVNKKDNKVEELDKIIKMSQINFIADLQNGIDEKVGYNGSRFSLGQKQRIAIARALFKDAPIVIFDEATSALDLETEGKIRNVIFNEMKDKTVILIAHRLSTVVECDNIYVMENGKIVESGTHKQLLENQQYGLYKRLWQNLNTNNN